MCPRGWLCHVRKRVVEPGRQARVKAHPAQRGGELASSLIKWA